MKSTLSLLRKSLFCLILGSASVGFADKDSCQSERLRISAGGDVIIHDSNYKSILNNPDGFYPLFAKIRPLIAVADVSYVNLEGAVAKGITSSGKDMGDVGFTYDCKVYCGTNFRFNYHPRLVSDLKRLGIDVVSMANNHALDRGSVGINKSIEALRDNEMRFSGVRSSGQPDMAQHTTTRAKGWNIAWVSCTEHTNDRTDSKNQVLSCGGSQVLKDIRRLAEDSRYDAVIVTPHWGPEYQPVDEDQVHRARSFVNAGATAVIGNHPHVLQRMDVMTSKSGRKVPVVYSLGNFIAGQDNFQKNLSAIFYLDLVKDGRGETVIESMSFVPIFRNALRKDKSYVFDLAPVEQFSQLTFFEKSGDGKFQAKSKTPEQALERAANLLAPAKLLYLGNLPRPTGNACR